MSTFWLYLQLGWEHILDPNGYDHVLFIVALCTVFSLQNFKQVVILATAFTLGHSITLALSALDLIQFNRSLIEFLIPVTIAITALSNFHKAKASILPSVSPNKTSYVSSFMATLFGLIHGMGFSSYFKSLLGKGTNITLELLSFNIGIEIAQLVIIFAFLIFSTIIIQLFGIKQRDWIIGISSGILAISILLAKDAIFW